MRKTRKAKRTRSQTKNTGNVVVQNILAISASVFVAILFAKLGTFEKMLEPLGDASIFGSFIAGLFFTSMVTIAPAAVVIGELVMSYNIFVVALFASIGCVLGDLVLIHAMEDISSSVGPIKHKKFKKFITLLRSKKFKWITPSIGAFALVIPIPDEIGLSILGLSKINKKTLAFLSFVFNFFGVLLIGSIARGLL